MSLKSRFRVLSICLVVMLVVIWGGDNTIASDDFISARSNKTARLNKELGTAVLIGDVRITHKSTASTLEADRVFLKRDKETSKLVQGKAEGKVYAVMNKLDETDKLTRTMYVRCKNAEFDKTIEEALLSGLVTVKSHDFIIKADRIFYDTKHEKGRITEIPGKQVEMTFFKNAVHDQTADSYELPEIGRVNGFANEVRFDKTQRKITLQGRVRFIDHMEQTSFVAEKADVYFDQADELERINAFEDVVISQPKRTSKADQAVFDYVTETINLIGNASVKEPDEMEIISSKISMYMNEEKGFVKGKPDVPLKTKVWVDE